MGIYDLPTMIDYILKTTGQEKLFYIGYSQGCTQFFVMGSLKPEYNDKIHLAVTLAPAVYLGNSKGILASLAKLSYPIGVSDFVFIKYSVILLFINYFWICISLPLGQNSCK